MPYAACQSCEFRGRVNDELLGKHIRCPRCRQVVLVTEELPVAAPKSEASGTASAEDLYVGKLSERRGPLSRAQLAMLVKWNLIDDAQILSNENATRRSTVREFLKNDGWPKPRVRVVGKPSADPASTPDSSHPELPEFADGQRPDHWKDFDYGPNARTTDSVIAMAAVDAGGHQVLHEDFRQLLDRAVQMERSAHTVESVRPGGESMAVWVPSPYARFVRRSIFSSACTGLSIVFLINAITYGIFASGLAGMFLKRLAGLCFSVFIPFENTAELIEGEALVSAGCALVLLIAELAIPIWILIRSDFVPWHAIAATMFGLLLGLALKPEWLSGVFMIARGAALVCGLGITGILAWLMSASKDPAVNRILAAPVLLTGFASIALAAVNASGILVVRFDQQSPTIVGAGLHVSIFAICFFIICISAPWACLSMLYPEAEYMTQKFMVNHLILGIVLAVLGGLMMICLVSPQTANFFNIPFALFPLVAGNMIAIMIPPLFWTLGPDYVLPRAGR